MVKTILDKFFKPKTVPAMIKNGKKTLIAKTRMPFKKKEGYCTEIIHH